MKNNKAENLREKLKQALTSTARVISDDIALKNIDKKNKKDLNFVNIENLNSKGDFIKARAESDSSALKKKFSNDGVYKKNLIYLNFCRFFLYDLFLNHQKLLLL